MDQLKSLKRTCWDFNSLNNWQLSKYRKAVTENKWYMGERLDRKVGWSEAEEDFLHKDFYGCAPVWRV